MRALLVQARSPVTYWSFEPSLRFIRKSTTMPPLGLATLAAHLPATWELRLRDLNVAPLEEADLAWADAVLVSGMLVQVDSIRDVLRRACAAGAITVVGGPAATTSPELFGEADHLFQGEAEGRLGRLVSALEAPEDDAPRILSPEGPGRPDLSALARVPRFDLLALDRYANHALQYSRGCPFHCEFCDIVEIFGRVPRVKTPAQVVAELDALHAQGARGPLFFVDDNFIGNRREVVRLLPAVRDWQERHGFPFDFCTEASLDLASDPALAEGMVAAGFRELFIGIETPSREALADAGKLQNLKLAPEASVERLTRAGFEVFAGFIVGFDSDAPDIFERQIALISSLPVPRAMVGLLTALPGTRLTRRLAREGRLRGHSKGDNFERPNFAPAMEEGTLLAGYRRVLAALYSPEGFYERCAKAIDQLPATGTRAIARGGGVLRTALRIAWGIGVLSPRRAHFWRLVRRALRRGLGSLPRAFGLAVLGESLVPYTQQVVLPRIDRAIQSIHPAPASAGPPPG